MNILCALPLFAATCLSLTAAGPPKQSRYLRPAGKEFATECTFTLQRSVDGTNITSVTECGKTTLTVTASHKGDDSLFSAQAILKSADQTKTATVKVTSGKATIERAGKPAQEFEVPAGVIVTSAPDWTDTFLLCQRYDAKKAGKQSFPGLWIHPTESCQRLTFSIEKQGADTIEHAGKKVTLNRHTIWLRGNSAYAAWADGEGKMIKLVPLPYKDGATNWIVLEGYEKSTATLRP